MINLGIETSSALCGVALFDDDKFLGEFSINSDNLHDQKLLTIIDNLFSSLNLSPDKIGCVSVSCGPGSFTGLRIGLATAKGLSLANNINIVAINTLDALAFKYLSSNFLSPEYSLCSLVDAKRDEFYYAVYKYNSETIFEGILDYGCDHFEKILENIKTPVIFIGKDIKNISKHLDNLYSLKYDIRELNYDPKIICKIGNRKFKNNQFENISSLEPFYLKDFIPVTKIKEV